MSTPTEQPAVLWEPTEEQRERATLTGFARWVAETRGVDVADDYHALWRWSVEDVDGFWAAIWEFFDVQSETGYERVLGSHEMPGAEWSPGAGAPPRRCGAWMGPGARLSAPRATSPAAASTPRSRSATPRSCASWAS